MLRMIKAEVYKLIKSKAFRILCGVAFGLVILIASFSSFMTEDRYFDTLGDIPQEEKYKLAEEMKTSSQDGPIVVPGQLGFNTNGAKDPLNVTPVEVFHVSFGVGVVEILISVLVASMFAKEYSAGTLKNTLAYGKKREQFYISKLIAILIGVAIIVSILVITPTIITIFSKDWIGQFKLTHLIEIVRTFAGAMILYTAIASILMLIVTMVKSNGATISISVLLFIFVPTFLAFNYGRYDWFDKLYELTIFYNTSLATAIKASSTDVLRASVVGICTLLVALLAGISIFKKQDIK